MYSGKARIRCLQCMYFWSRLCVPNRRISAKRDVYTQKETSIHKKRDNCTCKKWCMPTNKDVYIRNKRNSRNYMKARNHNHDFACRMCRYVCSFVVICAHLCFIVFCAQIQCTLSLCVPNMSLCVLICRYLWGNLSLWVLICRYLCSFVLCRRLCSNTRHLIMTTSRAECVVICAHLCFVVFCAQIQGT